MEQTSDYIVGEKWPIREAERQLGSRENVRYVKYIGKKYTWYVPNIHNSADLIHVDTHNKNSEGYGGSFRTFNLVTGDSEKVKAPWHSNSEALKDDTGVDLTRNHLTFVVISKGRAQTKDYKLVMKNVLYIDQKPQIGSFVRHKEHAKPFVEDAMKNGESLFYYVESSGGSSCGSIVWKGKLSEDFEKDDK